MFTVTKHDQKYDRQMRLWGGHGQKKLENAHICMLGSGPTASECLKNLVLPNVGNFTIIDNAIVEEADLGNNFFVDVDGKGKPRAEVVSDLLVEMNAEVKGNAVVKDPIEVINSNIDLFKDFSVVVACNIPEEPLLKLAAFCYTNNVPVVVLSAYGLLGYARLQIPEHCVIESHYENDRYDLFVHPEQLKVFPELDAFIEKFGDLNEIKDTLEHAHIPYVVILAKAMEAWIAKMKKPPTTWEQQKQFKASIKTMALKYEGDGAEENFHEAVLNAHRAYNKPSLAWKTQSVLDDNKAKEITAESSNFWILVAAVNKFIAAEGCLPCSVKIPDMTSKPDNYVELCQIYKARATRDESLIFTHAKDILTEVGLPADKITEEEVSYLVKNLRGIEIIRTGTLAEEYNASTFPTDYVNEIFQEWMEPQPEDAGPNPRVINWYFAYRTIQRFYTAHKRYPGTPFNLDEDTDKTNTEADSKECIKIQTALYEELKIQQKVEDICLTEMTRFGATEIHNISAYIGGVGSQIVLKTLIKQYVPLDNTYVFNGTHGAGQVFKLYLENQE